MAENFPYRTFHEFRNRTESPRPEYYGNDVLEYVQRKVAATGHRIRLRVTTSGDVEEQEEEVHYS